MTYNQLNSSFKHYLLFKMLEFTSTKINMSEENRRPTRQFVEHGHTLHAGEAGSVGEENLWSQLLDRRMSSNETNRIINAIVAPPSSQLETLILSARDLNERSSICWTEGNVMSERWWLSCQTSDTMAVENCFKNLEIFI